MSAMVVLVDYDNILQAHRRKGPKYVVDRILTAISIADLSHTGRARVRLYGGWYGRRTLTRYAQRISTGIQAAFPATVMLVEPGASLKVAVQVELAFSLEIEPAKHLWYTYRARGMPRGLQCLHPSTVGCTDPACPLLTVHQFFNAGKCPRPGCRVTPADVIRKGEQKLVDTMLTADLLHLAFSGTSRVTVVTSDDDLWPGIRTATLLGTHVIHIHTVAGRATRKAYAAGVGGSYSERNL